MKTNVFEISSIDQFKPSNITILYFYTLWHEPCVHLSTVYQELSIKYPKVLMYRINAEELEDLSVDFEIESVPTFIVLEGGKEVDRYQGQDAPKITALIQKYSNSKLLSKKENPKVNTKESLETLVNSHPLMIFIKGTPSAPKCGFSRQLIELLSELNCTYGSFDILADESVRQGLKEYSDWPTYPQSNLRTYVVYINGELIGGLDIVKEMIANGEFQQILPKEEDLNTRLKRLINQQKIMLFMKGNPSTPKCGFSRVTVGILQDQGVEFGTFDILEDEEVRQGLKEYSDWPT